MTQKVAVALVSSDSVRKRGAASLLKVWYVVNMDEQALFTQHGKEKQLNVM